ncbi:hypothetical protein PQ459_14150 [Chryseobacterium sp. KACC 21268]|nr:hypothetical protein PQ459_14150 [Chryseobacterium sp. KACC 21268]
MIEFSNENKGIIIPQIATPNASSGGTFVYNSSERSVEVWEGRTNNDAGGWVSLTKNGTPGVNHTFTNLGSDVNTNTGAVIGAANSSKIGILVLESTTRALVLPNVANPQLNMRGTIAGTLVYDSISNTFAIYDGVNWSYWK